MKVVIITSTHSHTTPTPNTLLTNKHSQLNILQTLPLLHSNVDILEKGEQNSHRRKEPQRRLLPKETHQAKKTENNDIGLVEREEAPADAEGGIIGWKTGAVETDIPDSPNAAVGEEEHEKTGIRLAEERLHGDNLSYESDGGNDDEGKNERTQRRGDSVGERFASCRRVDEKKEEQRKVEENGIDGIETARDHQGKEGEDDGSVIQPNDGHRSLTVFFPCQGCGRGALEMEGVTKEYP